MALARIEYRKENYDIMMQYKKYSIRCHSSPINIRMKLKNIYFLQKIYFSYQEVEIFRWN
jgi:hypothetical protein